MSIGKSQPQILYREGSWRCPPFFCFSQWLPQVQNLFLQAAAGNQLPPVIGNVHQRAKQVQAEVIYRGNQAEFELPARYKISSQQENQHIPQRINSLIKVFQFLVSFLLLYISRL